MSQEKAQLIAPIDSSFTVPGLTVSGVITATSFDGTITGVADSITQGKNLNVGVVTALSFAGNLTGNAGGLIGSPNTVAGVVTGTSFIGGLTGNITGDVIGNASGIGASIKQGVNLNVGIATASTWYGDASGVTGAGVTAFIAQEITASSNASSETIIDLSNGNLIYFDQTAKSTTVGFASTAATQEITIIRDTGTVTPSFVTGAVDFDGTGDYLSLANDSDLQPGSGDFTFEAWIYPDSWDSSNYDGIYVTGATDGIWLGNSAGNWVVRAYGVTNYISVSNISTGQWTHVAVTREGTDLRLFFNGVLQSSVTNSKDFSASSTQAIGSDGAGADFDGKISNLRFVKGTAVYTAAFDPPFYDLTNITNTKLLCCQSDSSTTTAAVTTGTITANGDPTAGSQTVTSSSTVTPSITWPDRVTWTNNVAGGPTLISNSRAKAFQVFRFLSADTGLTYKAWEEMKNNAETFGLYGAGATGYGALGINVSSGGYYSSPVQIPGTSWSSLIDSTFPGGVGGAVKNDGTMWVWGKTNYGILGLNVYGAGLSDSVSSPIQLGTETTWESACFGGDNSAGCMAIKTDGTLWGWGQNRYGTLGLNDAGIPGSLPNEYKNSRSSPAQVGTDTTWKFVNYGGEDVILSIKTNGTLWSWGGNNAGQAGQNTPGSTPALRSSPVQVGTDTSWAYASNCRNGTSIATKTDGTLWCWGDNSKGQCGQNTIAPSSYNGLSSPTQVGAGTDWNYDNGSKIVAGYQRVFAIKTNGTLWGWGRTHQGQLGLNEGGNKDYSSPTQIPGTNWATIKSVGEVIATKTDGTLWTWGDNGPGALMLNDRTDRSSPTQVPGIWNSGERGIRAADPHFALKVE